MYVLIQENVDGSLKLHWGSDVKLDPKNGGWVQIQTTGGSVGVPIGQVKAATHVPGT